MKHSASLSLRGLIERGRRKRIYRQILDDVVDDILTLSCPPLTQQPLRKRRAVASDDPSTESDCEINFTLITGKQQNKICFQTCPKIGTQFR